MPDFEKTEKLLYPILAVIMILLLAVGGIVFLLQRQQTLHTLREERDIFAALDGLASNMIAEQQTDTLKDNQTFIEDAIRQVLQTQQKAWNDGDIDQFMQSYWKSDELTFSSGGKVTRGWQATLDGYKQRYTSRREMGTLAFSELEITPLGRDAALVLGNWRLTREADTPGGKFSLVFRRIEGQWLIVHDHTSKAEQ